MKKLIAICLVVTMVLAVGGVANADIIFSGQPAKNPPLTGTISLDASNMYISATVTNAAIVLDEDYLAIALDVDNNNRWTASRDALLVHESPSGGVVGASWRLVKSPLDYDPSGSDYVWDCPWSDPAVKPGDASWLVGMSITVTSSGNDAVYNAVIPFAAMGVSDGDTVGVLVQTRDKNVALYGGNGRVLNYWPNSTCFNALYDPAQFQDIPIPEPATVALLGLGALSLLRRKK